MDDTQGILAFEKTTHAFNFEEYRVLDTHIINKWVSVIKKEFEVCKCTSNILLDVGAGTGRFSLPFAKENPTLKVVAMDKSRKMLEILEKKEEYLNLSNIQTFCADVENFLFNEKIAVAFFSEMLHLLSNLEKSFFNVYNNLSNGGFCCVRTVSHDQLANVEWIKFFDGALEIEQQRTYDVPEIVDTFRRIGFSKVTVTNIDESSIFSSDFYTRMLYEKVYSLLHILDETVFQKGYEKVVNFCKFNENCKHTMELACIVARK